MTAGNGGRNLAALTVLLVLLVSCGDTSLLNPADTEMHSLEVKSISEGQTLQSNSPVEIRIDSPELDDPPTRLDVNLFDSSGELVADQSIEDPQIDRDLQIDLPPLSTGRYRIEFMLYGNGTVLVDRELSFFYTTDEYTIQGIESFPPVITPGSTVLLRAQLGLPADAAPYIRWKQGASTLAEGPLIEGLGSIYWTAPGEDGVYTISVEIFPVAPGSGERFDFTSSIFMKTELYTSSADGAPSTDLSPDESYFSLFHFNGNLEDSAPAPDGSSLPAGEEIGNLLPAVHENILGFRFTAGSGFSVPRMVLPFSYGTLQPFTLSMGISWTSPTPGASIVHIADDQGSFSLQVTTGDGLAPEATMTAGGKTFVLPSEMPEIQLRRRYLLSLSLVPDVEAGALDARWFLDDQPHGFLHLTTGDLTRAGAAGRTVVGGAKGFDGILDELGVYHTDGSGQPSANPAYF